MVGALTPLHYEIFMSPTGWEWGLAHYLPAPRQLSGYGVAAWKRTLILLLVQRFLHGHGAGATCCPCNILLLEQEGSGGLDMNIGYERKNREIGIGIGLGLGQPCARIYGFRSAICLIMSFFT